MSQSVKNVKLDPDVHAWLVLLSEKYQTTLSGVIRKFVTEQEPEIITLQDEIEKLKQKRLGSDKTN
jgi:hypothetical protein